MIYQIAGTVLLTTSLICGTWYAVTIQKEREKARIQERREREARNKRTFENESLALYQDELTRRRDAEAQVKLQKELLRRSRNEVERLKGLIKELEANS